MKDNLVALKKLIKKEADKLLVDTHPYLVDLRDRYYIHFEELVMQLLTTSGDSMSIQTAFAQIEQEIGIAILT